MCIVLYGKTADGTLLHEETGPLNSVILKPATAICMFLLM